MSVSAESLPSDPRANYHAHKDDIDDAIARVLEGGRYVLGEEVRAFEQEFASYIGVRFGIGVASGTDALQLAMRASGLGEGDEVITVSHTAVGTVAATELCGATPVLVDIDMDTFTIDPDRVEEALTEQTKAIVPVHLYGHPANMEAITRIADRQGIRVIEDCAQSHGASYQGRKTGAWGAIAAFSFYPTKNLGAIGDAGMVVTNDPELATSVKELREYGWHQRYVSERRGLNSRLDELQAGILRVKLRHLDEENAKRQALASIYSDALSSTSLILPKCLLNATHVYHQYVVRSRRRDALRRYLQENGIGTLIHYPVPIHRQPAYSGRLRCAGSLINTDSVATEILSLPIYPELSQNHIRHIAEIVTSFDRNTA